MTVATLNADKYSDYVYRFHFSTFPVIAFYRKGDPVLNPILYYGDIELYSLHDFVEDQLDDFYSS